MKELVCMAPELNAAAIPTVAGGSLARDALVRAEAVARSFSLLAATPSTCMLVAAWTALTALDAICPAASLTCIRATASPAITAITATTPATIAGLIASVAIDSLLPKAIVAAPAASAADPSAANMNTSRPSMAMPWPAKPDQVDEGGTKLGNEVCATGKRRQFQCRSEFDQQPQQQAAPAENLFDCDGEHEYRRRCRRQEQDEPGHGVKHVQQEMHQPGHGSEHVDQGVAEVAQHLPELLKVGDHPGQERVQLPAESPLQVDGDAGGKLVQHVNDLQPGPGEVGETVLGVIDDAAEDLVDPWVGRVLGGLEGMAQPENVAHGGVEAGSGRLGRHVQRLHVQGRHLAALRRHQQPGTEGYRCGDHHGGNLGAAGDDPVDSGQPVLAEQPPRAPRPVRSSTGGVRRPGG